MRKKKKVSSYRRVDRNNLILIYILQGMIRVDKVKDNLVQEVINKKKWKKI